ncbi:MAG: hypothetical protein CMJ25_30950 [Phycisphaerae bacterium]|nr:hypothetical protein [Phycisphaerae bacterium]|tara:strand:+ start:85 stop:318 length:234 start_codon:yes stop_codon:yes gene_type:complete
MDDLNIDEAIDIAIRNTYDLYMETQTYEDIIEGDYPMFIHDIDSGIVDEDLDFLISYFETTEEYEKCSDIKNKRDEV